MLQLMVRDVMTADPVTVTPATALKELARVLVEQGSGAVPVLSQHGKVIGMVTQDHLLRKQGFWQLPQARHWFVADYVSRRRDATAETVSEVMTWHPVTVHAEATAAEAARLMDRHNVTCLPVLGDDGKLAGVVTARDLLKVFLRRDGEIRAQIIEEVLRRYLGTNPATVTVEVRDGVVNLTGELGQRSMLPLVLPAVRAIDGVIDAEAQLSYAVDDTSLPRTPSVFPDY